eukprot:2120671-Amphidinium_carterae.1
MARRATIAAGAEPPHTMDEARVWASRPGSELCERVPWPLEDGSNLQPWLTIARGNRLQGRITIRDEDH